MLLAGGLALPLAADGASAVLITQAGLAGIGFFAIALLAGELAGRLAREEIAARGSMELARQQAQLNRLVIEEMADGVLVVDRELRVRATNPAARSLLSATGPGAGGAVPAAGPRRMGGAERRRCSARWPRPTGPRPAATWC